ncbi:MAG: tRNA (adenosine(37)-N6)-dimethylallyltransferase MiaA [Candidatus Gastranaerophilaceae bacterium]
MKKSNLKKKVIAVVGPTASGKTAFAVDLANKINGEIISADSRLVYRGFDIGTAKPTKAEMQEIPHYMIDIVEPECDYTAALYAREASKIIDSIISRGKTPIVAGGTGLYFRLLLENYVMPEVEPNYDLRKELEKYSSEDLHNMLSGLDAESAAKIYSTDKKKLIRALEIVKTLGKPISEVRGVSDESDYEVEWIGLNFPREELYDRINRRVDVMIDMGLVEETKNLLKKHGNISNIINTIGYREITKYLNAKMSLEEAKNLLKQNTRNYAKRQLTWFRKNSAIKWNVYPEKLKK